MPYTPPSHCSPPSSAPTSASSSRRSSFNSGTTSQPRPALPRSASYLTRHRRSTSATSAAAVPSSNYGSTPDITPPGTSDNLKNMAVAHSSTIRQSPPPIADSKAMPPGAIISPPESSSEDEGVVDSEDRMSEIEIKELKEAISAIPQCRVSSPTRNLPDALVLQPSQMAQHKEAPKPTIRTTDFKPGRAPSHSRSKTDTDIYYSKSPETSFNTSEESSEQDEMVKKPPMLRKKSGELVRPALRPASLRRPSSMPGTPTFSKAVHFDSHLEHVRHFLQVDRPLAVSTGSSPVDNYDSDTEFPFKRNDAADVRSPQYEWEIVTANFPSETPIRKSLPVKMERVWMSPDQKSLMGSISVANLAFQKAVACRFTFDYWKTTSEVGAEYQQEIRERESEIGHDRFQFSIKLSDIANLEAKTLFFCTRYNVNGLEYWDNNDNINFQVDFRKRLLPKNGKKGPQASSSRSANVLPRSNRRTNPSTLPRPRSMPAGALDEFGPISKLTNLDQPIHDLLGESEPTGLRLKSTKSSASIASDNLPARLSAPSGAAFANRYDFSASLSAAKQAQKSPNSSPRQNDGLYMKAHQRGTFDAPTPSEVPRSQSNVPQIGSLGIQQSVGPQTHASTLSSSDGVTPSSTSIASASYEEILNKYCFFNGSKQTSPQLKDGTLAEGRYDGADEYSTLRSASNHLSMGGNPSSVDRPHHGAAPHTLHQPPDLFHDPYFTPNRSPAESPSQGLAASGKLPNSSDANYLAGSNTTSIPPVPSRSQYRRNIRDRSPFASDTHAAKAISC